VTASVDVAGRLVVDAGTNTLGFSGDSSNFLATYEVNTFFHGQGAGGLTLSSDILANASLISTGAIDPLTSAVNSGDNSSAIAVLAIQNSAISFDGSAALSLHDRTTTLSGTYGTDVAIADQQLVYRQAESESLARQREAISGVNVDEELITMIKYQRAYEAAAKVVSTTNTMLDSLMGIVR